MAAPALRPTARSSHSESWGVLKLTLKNSSYTWEFIPVAGKSFRDSGSGTCSVRPAQ